MRPLTILLAALVCISTPAAAQLNRTAVSATGLDSNPCSVTQPCRSISTALTRTNPGGELIILDSAGYGPFVVTQAVTVQAAPGAYAGITQTASAPGIEVSAASAADTVSLRGLTLNGRGALVGISLTGAPVLHVENCLVAGFPTGIAQQTSESVLHVSDTVIRDAGSTAVSVKAPAFGPFGARASLNRVEMRSVSAGVYAQENARLTIRDSIISQANAGIVASTVVAQAPVAVVVENTTITLTGQALVAAMANNAGVVAIWLSRSTIATNTEGLATGPGGTIYSFGNNAVANNGSSVAPTPIALQ